MRLAPILTVAILAAVGAVPTAAEGARGDVARSRDGAVLSLTAAGKRALRGVTVQAVSPASSGRDRLRLPARTVAVAGGVATVELGGALRFRSGRRSVTATALRLTAASTSSTLSGRLGRSRVTLFSARGRPVLDTGARSIGLTGARAALTPAAATRLKSALRLKRAPSTAALGTLALTAASATPPPAPAPVIITPAASATPAATPTPTPTPTGPGAAPPCADRFTATPAGSTDWFGCDLPGSSDLKSWTDYIQRFFPPTCALGTGTVTASGGAERVDPAAAYDHRFPIVAADRRPDGSATIRVQGAVTYTMPAHGIDEAIGAFRIEIAPGGLSGQVFADGRSNGGGGMTCGNAPAQYAGEHVFDLDMTQITPVTSGGVTRWVHVPATIAAGTNKIGGGSYPAGSRWGSFTIAVAGGPR